MTAFNVSCSSSDKFLAIRACLCKKPCVHCGIGALSLICFTTPELIPVHAAPSDGLTKRGARCKKVRGPLFSVQKKR